MFLLNPVRSAIALALIVGASVGLAAFEPSAAQAIAQSIGAAPPDNDVVSISWGDWIVNLLPLLGTVALSAALGAWAVIRTFIPAPLRALVDPIADRAIREAVDYALNAVEGAAKGRTLDVTVGNAVLRTALDRLEEKGDAFTRRAGGSVELAKRIIAHLDLVPEAKVVTDRNRLPAIVARVV